MGKKLHNRLNVWKKLLLDFGKRNRLINFKEGKCANVKITAPSCEKIFEEIVIHEHELIFPHAKKIHIDENGEETYESIIEGNVETNKTIGDLQKSLKVLRYRSKTSIEEQGINILFLAFGLLKWNDKDTPNEVLYSPIILVPVRLIIESFTSPYKLQLHDDEIVVNPTLAHKLENDFGIILPEFDSTQDDIEQYFSKIEHTVEVNGWNIDRCVNLTYLSFMKINMYKDLERNEEKLNQNEIISAIAGEEISIDIPEEIKNFDHDAQEKPIDTFQVVDADSSQQDAITLSKQGASFVLQGPPGTGKSQTITNIIAEALADGKKVLFVSEKMAALQVVYNRLAGIGLADFCFILHSHKANKKAILNELSNSISIDHTKVRDEALVQLDTLEKKRQQLNQYDTELHTPCSGLNISVFTVNGRLAKLSSIPDIVFAIETPDKYTIHELEDKKYLLNELSKTIVDEEYVENVWRESNIRYLSNDLKNKIDSNLAITINLFTAIQNALDQGGAKLEISTQHTWNKLQDLINILDIASKSPIIPTSWIYDLEIDDLKEKSSECESDITEIKHIKSGIEEKYRPEIFEIEAETVKADLTHNIEQLREKIYSDSDNDLADKLVKNVNKIVELKSKFEEIYHIGCQLAVQFGIEKPDNIHKLKQIISFVHILSQNNTLTPHKGWFNNVEFKRTKETFAGIRALHEDVMSLKKQILSNCDKEIFEEDFYPTLQKFRGEYSSIFRIFNKEYKADKSKIKKYILQGGHLSYKTALQLLNNLKQYHDKSTEILTDSEQYKSKLGEYYSGLETNWDDAEKAIKDFAQLTDIQPEMSEICQHRLLERDLPLNELNQYDELTTQNPVENIFTVLKSLLCLPINEEYECEKLIDESAPILKLAIDFITHYEEITNLRKTETYYDEIISELSKLSELHEDLDKLADKEEENINRFKEYYSSLDTDWETLNKALDYAERLKEIIEKYNLSKEFAENICRDKESVAYSAELSTEISTLKNKSEETFTWFTELFDNKEKFCDMTITDLIRRMTQCKENKHLLEEWIDYCENKKKCAEEGLGEYVHQIEEQKIPADQVVDAYLKRFYHLWLDAVLPQFPILRQFRGRQQDAVVSDFCKLDVDQFKIAQARVREKVTSRIPDFNSITSTHDEIGILKRELNKQRRIMPLRKLFKEIPNLVTTLKPCFMMSPLSVSVFLEAESYGFDLVIFDEASQVHTEDAIGAIMRAKQAIIVGDTKQLPPTNFFTTTLNDEEFDIAQEEENTDTVGDAYESILDEAVTILPERSLRWHYRSRDEHLIAFSNVKIYNSSLITFPSPIEKGEDVGVEYIHVEDGVYDRSKRRNNPIEAQRVAELVFEHFRQHPERSLGVVTFSEAQQNAVDSAIRKQRQKNKEYEKYFNEDNEHPFFIKNLENVQGDERDTIIFSIGYAKDASGVMYMNFGPLSRVGGYRRLNVAITRAKYNVKLVGSIMPTDIDLSKTSAEGVHLLRSYMEFAIQGTTSLENELRQTQPQEDDTNFEESVTTFLKNRGYKVDTNVGCSEFRVDIAVKNPEKEGEYLIGIECDGSAYHRSRTARERDRLHQQVLESMGWKIYRIWSIEWIKDQKNEEEKLISIIESTMRGEESEPEEEVKENIEEPIEEIVDIKETDTKNKEIETYNYCDIDQCADLTIEETIKKIVAMEQPIHFDELCRRISVRFNSTKVTPSIKREVMASISILKEEIELRPDKYLVETKFEGVKVRRPDTSKDYVRNITAICDEEIELAMKMTIKKSFGITKDGLYLETAQIFGFKRVGDKIHSIFDTIYANMLQTGEIQENKGKVTIKNG